jgi:uncharacterized protein YajQ (UPF0234 family)
MPSFDVVSKVESHEIDNAVQQARHEVDQRYDFRDTETSIERTEEGITLRSNSEGRLEAALKVLEEKIVRRKISLKVLDANKPEPAGGSMHRQLVKLKQGIDQDRAKKIVKLIKDAKMKVQAAIQGDTVRISGKKRDDLQEAIKFLKAQEIDLPLQFTNFRD